MSKKNLYIMNKETGEYEPIERIGDIHAEQLTLDLDEAAPSFDEFDISFSGTIDVDKDQLMEFLDEGWVVDPDDIRQELISCMDEIHNTVLDGIYHVARTEDASDIDKADKIVEESLNKLFEKYDTLTELYFKACFNEYKIERDDAKAALEAFKLN